MLRIAVAVVALLAAALVACGGEDGDDAAPATSTQQAPAESSAPTTVESEDGAAALNIPARALPDGVTPRAVEVLEVSADPDLSVPTEGDPPLAIFQLEPDGLQLSDPVTLTVQLPVDDPSGQLFAIHVFGEETELISDTASDFDPKTKTLTASIQLTHFSTVIFTCVENPFEADMQVSALDVPFAETFDVTVIVTRVSDPVDVIEFYEGEQANAYIHLADTPWRLRGSLLGEGSVRPPTIEDVPSLTSVSGSTFTIPAQAFECASPGGGWVYFDGPVQYQQSVVWSVPGCGVTGLDLEDKTANVSASNGEIQCVIPGIVASTAPPITTDTLSPELPSATFFA